MRVRGRRRRMNGEQGRVLQPDSARAPVRSAADLKARDGIVSGQRLIGAHLPTTHPERRETRPGRCSGCLTRFVVDVRLPWPSRCPDCGGSVVSEGEVEPVARRLPFEGPRRQRRSRGAPLGGSAAASGLGTSMVRARP